MLALNTKWKTMLTALAMQQLLLQSACFCCRGSCYRSMTATVEPLLVVLRAISTCYMSAALHTQWLLTWQRQAAWFEAERNVHAINCDALHIIMLHALDEL